jgi:uncharacterized iron-regulated protein
MSFNYLKILDKLLIKGRTVIRESERYYKVYLPADYNEVWEVLRKHGRTVTAIVLLPREISGINKIMIPRRRVVRENIRYKIYLPLKYNDVWRKIAGEKVDILIIIH